VLWSVCGKISEASSYKSERSSTKERTRQPPTKKCYNSFYKFTIHFTILQFILQFFQFILQFFKFILQFSSYSQAQGKCPLLFSLHGDLSVEIDVVLWHGEGAHDVAVVVDHVLWNRALVQAVDY
jgi:hypothetical protein